MFNVIVGIVGVVASACAAMTGFGIGSLLTPLLALQYPTKVAVAVVAIPHFIGTMIRLAGLWRRVDKPVVIAFGILSAAGSFAGALLTVRDRGSHSPVLTTVFALLMIFAGASVLFHLAERMRFGRTTAGVAGAVSGFFGGLVGNQGGIRSAALLGFEINKESFVATAMAIAVTVDIARLPVYFATQSREMLAAWQPMACAAAGVVIGTFWGARLLRRVPERAFRKGVATLVMAIGVAMLVSVIRRM